MARHETSHNRILTDLQHDVQALKKQLHRPDAKMKELMLEIEGLRDSIHELTGIFKNVIEDVRSDSDVTHTIVAMKEKMNTLITQNDAIAQHVNHLTDKVDGLKRSTAKPARAPLFPKVNHTMGAPVHHTAMPRMAPRPQMQPPTPTGSGLPPPPPSVKKGKGLFA